ncbi:MAG: hypothetical protein ACF8MJ_03570 [Phycisphaerales bacterium JB050]
MTRTPLFAIALAALSSTANAQLARITPNDATNNDDFGTAVAIDGDLMLIGSGNDDNSGSIYLFEASTGLELGKLVSPDNTPNARFGEAVDLDGNFAVVGAPRADPLGFLSGVAFILDISDPSQPTLLHTLQAADGASGASFGLSVAIDGDTAIIGAPGLNAAYLFSVSTGQQLAKLQPANFENNDGAGTAVEVQDGLAFVSSPFDDIQVAPFDTRSNAGSITIFDISTPTAPVQAVNFTTIEPTTADEFGYAMDVDGTTLVVGAPNANQIPTFVGNGAVFIVDITNPASPAQLFKVRADNPRTGADFGWSVSIDGSIILAGAPNGDAALTTNGLGYLLDASTGAQIVRLQTDPLSPFTNRLGDTAAISDGIAALGAPLDGNSTLDPGAVYTFGAQSPCPGDASDDGIVDLADLNLVLANFGTANSAGDANGDGMVDLADLNLVLANFGVSC